MHGYMTDVLQLKTANALQNLIQLIIGAGVAVEMVII